MKCKFLPVFDKWLDAAKKVSDGSSVHVSGRVVLLPSTRAAEQLICPSNLRSGFSVRQKVYSHNCHGRTVLVWPAKLKNWKAKTQVIGNRFGVFCGQNQCFFARDVLEPCTWRNSLSDLVSSHTKNPKTVCFILVFYQVRFSQKTLFVVVGAQTSKIQSPATTTIKPEHHLVYSPGVGSHTCTNVLINLQVASVIYFHILGTIKGRALFCLCILEKHVHQDPCPCNIARRLVCDCPFWQLWSTFLFSFFGLNLVTWNHWSLTKNTQRVNGGIWHSKYFGFLLKTERLICEVSSTMLSMLMRSAACVMQFCVLVVGRSLTFCFLCLTGVTSCPPHFRQGNLPGTRPAPRSFGAFKPPKQELGLTTAGQRQTTRVTWFFTDRYGMTEECCAQNTCHVSNNEMKCVQVQCHESGLNNHQRYWLQPFNPSSRCGNL